MNDGCNQRETKRVKRDRPDDDEVDRTHEQNEEDPEGDYGLTRHFSSCDGHGSGLLSAWPTGLLRLCWM